MNLRNSQSSPQKVSDNRPDTRFHADKMVVPVERFVAWVDIMGMVNKMSRSLFQSANFIGKFHIVCEWAATKNNGTYFPVMDGAFAVFETASATRRFFDDAFAVVADSFCREHDNEHRYLVRAGVSHGNVYLPGHFTEKVSKEFSKIAAQANILMGFPVIQAHLVEGKAPPFGVYVHEAARGCLGKNEKPKEAFAGAWYHWRVDEDQRKRLVKCGAAYFTWCRNHSEETDYPIDAINQHERVFKSFFSSRIKCKTKSIGRISRLVHKIVSIVIGRFREP